MKIIVFVLSVNFVLLGSFVHAQMQSTAFTEAEEMPYFPGCDQYEEKSEAKRNCSNEAVIAFISNNLSYPESAVSEGIQGTVYVNFTIDKTGHVINPKIIKGIDQGCDQEALRVLNEMPTWEPAMNKGETVEVQLNLPIRFFLSDDNADKASDYQINWGSLAEKKVSADQLKQNLSKKLIIRDQYGDKLHFSELIFSFEKRLTYLEAKSNGSINAKMKRLINKVRPGGIFKITAFIQKDGDYVEIEKSFEVVKNRE